MSEDGGQERPPDATPAAADVSAGGAADPEGGRAPEVKNQEGVLEDAARGLQDNRDDPSRVESTQSDFALDAAPPSHPLSDDSVSARPHDGGGPSENGKGGAPKTETAENVRLPFYDRPDPAGREQREQPEFEDPTVRLAPTGSGKPRFRRLKDSAQVAAGNLLDNGLVFIACAHQELAEAACLAVAYHSLIPKSRERRHWVPDDPRTLTELFASEDRVRSLGEKARQGDGGHDLVVVVHIHSADILRHLLDAAPRLRNAFWQSLRVGFIFVVTQGAAVQPPMVKELSWWEIDILTELIVDASGTEEDARRLSEDLNQGRQLGLWPQSLDQFATDVDRVLQNGGVEALQKEIGHRRDSQADERPDARAKACIESANLAERVALFVASFFPRCSVSDFQELYAAAANGRMVTVEQPSVGSDGKRVVEVTLTSYWEEHESRVMVRTKLRYAEDEDIVRIEFEEPAFGDAIRKALPKAFVLSCAKAVEKLLVNRRTPANVIGPIVELVRKQAEQFHNQYGADWLRTFLQIPPADPLDPSDDALPEGNTLDRIESICRALLSSPKTSDFPAIHRRPRQRHCIRRCCGKPPFPIAPSGRTGCSSALSQGFGGRHHRNTTLGRYTSGKNRRAELQPKRHSGKGCSLAPKGFHRLGSSPPAARALVARFTFCNAPPQPPSQDCIGA